MNLWEQESLNDREKIFAYLYQYNPEVAEKTDDLIVKQVTNLLDHPKLGVKREVVRGRRLILPELSLIVAYEASDQGIHILRVLHQKQQFPHISV